MRFEYQGVSSKGGLRLWPVSAIHLDPTPRTDMKPPGDPAVTYGLAAIGVLTVLVAAINFVNLMTARASKRVIEVGVRKATGASRRNLIVQFIGESLIYAVLGLVFALSAVHFALPALNSSLDRTISFAYGQDAALAATVAGLAVVIGVLAACTRPSSCRLSRRRPC